MIIQAQCNRICVRIKQMGNQCTPRTHLHQNADPSNFSKSSQSQMTPPSYQIILTPNLPPNGHKNRVYMKRTFSSQQKDEPQTPQTKREGRERVLDLNNKDAFNSMKQDLIQNLETKETLLSPKNANMNGQTTDKQLGSSEKIKRKLKISVQYPSQIRDSLIQAWNKSNFDQAEFFRSVHYEQIFKKSSKMHITGKK